jgi:hypothetical protein
VQRKVFFVVFIAAVLFLLPAQNASAAGASVRVTIPTFKVTVNDRVVDSTRLRYPPVVYGNITYFPLTARWCEELGLVSAHTDEDGLYIANEITQSQGDAPLDDGGRQAAGSAHTASIPDYPIYVNGRRIDNGKEAYPLLRFRGVPYFPLTWRFVTEEFGWDQAWSDKSGYKLSIYGGATDPSPGSRYFLEHFYIDKTYREYAILQKVKREISVAAKADENGDYAASDAGDALTFLKLDYAADALTEIAPLETEDAPYASGAVQGEDASEWFSGDGAALTFRGKPLADLSEDAEEGNAIDMVYAEMYTVNGLTVYKATAYFTQGEISVPAPYTPHKDYAWIDKGDGVLRRVESWPGDQILSAVYPFGSGGAYLCSTHRSYFGTRFGDGRGWICAVGADLSETTLNGRWEAWNSLRAVGMDDAGNLCLLNTRFSDDGLPLPSFPMGTGFGAVNPVRDGYYRLALDGTLSKVYPFVRADAAFVTPAGEIYIDEVRKNTLLHLQTGKRIGV